MERMKKRLIGAISYPAFLIFAALSAMTFIFLYVIPQFETALEGFRDKIDPTALMVFNMSSFLRTNIQTIGLSLGALVVCGLVMGKLGQERGIWMRIFTRIPLLRSLFIYEATLKFCRTLAVLIGNGVDISTTLRLLRDVVRLPAFRAEIDGVVADVRKGRRLSEALETRAILPRHVVQMLRVGEESGRLAGCGEPRRDVLRGAPRTPRCRERLISGGAGTGDDDARLDPHRLADHLGNDPR